MKFSSSWPVVKTYDGQHLSRIAMPLGGIGTGTVSLGGRGDLRDWEIMNRPAKGFAPVANNYHISNFFALHVQAEGEEPKLRLLEGPIELADYEGSHGTRARNHGLPRFREASFAAAYPFGQVTLSDPAMPVDVRLEAFNPLIPADADRSGLPVAVMRYVLKNRTAKPLKVAIAGVLPNFIGQDGSVAKKDWIGDINFRTGQKDNRNEFRKSGSLQGVHLTSEGVDKAAPQWGSISLSSPTPGRISHRTNWKKTGWWEGLLEMWDDLLADGALDDPADMPETDLPVAALVVGQDLPARGTTTITFLVTWHFPNRATWTNITDEEEAKLKASAAADAAKANGTAKSECCDPSTGCCEPGDAKAKPAAAPSSAGCCDPESGCCDPTPAADPRIIGNYYTERFADSWDAALSIAGRLDELEADSLAFTKAFCASDLPDVVKEAALFNVSTLRTQTCFRTPDGRFYGWEGIGDRVGCCYGSCTHVWNYEQSTAFLFGELARTMRDVEYAFATNDEGLMSFRVDLPLGLSQRFPHGAADGQLGCLMKLYRDWQLSGDDAMLSRLWPGAKRSLEFCWLPGSWDADQDGVMEGCQHNTMDVEYFGPNPQMQTWYLGALRAAEEMARYLDDTAFADMCMDFYTNGAAWMDKSLFNGEYYEHHVIPIPVRESIRKGLQIGMSPGDLNDPNWQLASGCLVDQMVGQYMAHICGLGHLLDHRKVRRSLEAVMQYNHRDEFHTHFNALRSFVLGDEKALTMASYPHGNRPRNPFPYYTEVMTGFEYTAAVGMLYEGMEAEGLQVIADIRERYDGQRRNPFDEAECGHHYARAMAAWGAVIALSGFNYSAVRGAMSFKAAPGQMFWSTGDAWGTCTQKKGRKGTMQVRLRVLYGSLRLERFALTGLGDLRLPKSKVLRPGRTLTMQIG